MSKGIENRLSDVVLPEVQLLRFIYPYSGKNSYIFDRKFQVELVKHIME